MLHGVARVARIGAALGLCIAVLGCNVKTLEAVPPYPGSSIGPGYRMEEGPATALKQIYYTPDSYAEVIAFYRNYVAKEPGWEGSPSREMTVWRKNMKVDQSLTSATPVDVTKPGKLIVVVSEGNRTTIRTFSSFPNS